MQPKERIKEGDTVRVIGQRQKAVVLVVYRDIPGGVILDRKIQGFRSWNKDRLVKETPWQPA